MSKTLFQLLFILLLLLFLLAIVHIYDTKEGYNYSPIGSPTSITKYDPSNYNIQYHATAEDIQSQLDLDLSSNLINVRDASGNIIQKPVSQMASETTYYTSGTLKYNSANYVPDYEDTIYFSKLTGLGYQTPIFDTNAQLSGFCKYDKHFPEKLEEQCGKLDSKTCASTTCCVLMGGKCFAGNYKGPIFKAHYGDIDLRNKDKYYYMGRCYGNCIDDQNNYYDYSVTSQTYKQTMPGFTEDDPAYLPNVTDYLKIIAPDTLNSSLQNPNSILTKTNCRIDNLNNLVDSNGMIIAKNASLDSNNNFIDSNGHILECISAPISSPTSTYTPSVISPAPIPAATYTPSVTSPAPIPTATYAPSVISPVPAPVSSTSTVNAPAAPTPSPPVRAPVPAPAPVRAPVPAPAPVRAPPPANTNHKKK